MPDSTPTHEETPFIEIVRRLSDVHAATAEKTFASSFEAVLDASGFGSRLSLLVRSGEVWNLVASSFSSALADQTKRLHAPFFTTSTIDDLFGTANGLVALDAATELSIDRQTFPVSAGWRMGSSGTEFCVLLHDEVGVDATGQGMVEVIEQHLETAFFTLQKTTRFQTELDLLRAKLEAINEIGELLGSLDLDVLLTRLMELSLYVVSGQVGSIVLRRRSEDAGDDDGSIDSAIEWGLPLHLIENVVDSSGQALFQSAMKTGESVAVESFDDSEEWQFKGEAAMESYICVPLVSKNGSLGAINIVNCNASGMDTEVLTTICGLAATSVENALLYEDSLEKERYAESLKIARDIQRKLYPESAPSLSWLDFCAITDSCDETGGDYYDYVESGDGITVVVGDVSGHGIGAALHMVAARAALRATLDAGSDIAGLLGRVNEQLERDMDVDQFMTIFLGRFEKDRPIVFVNAGHDAPIIYRRERDQTDELDATGIPVGLFNGQNYGLGQSPALAPGDVILATTDGVWEVYDVEGKELFGKDRLLECFVEFCRKSECANEIARNILERVNTFTGGRPARDDVTILVLRAREDR